MASEIWTIGKILKWTEDYFTQKGIESPRLDAEVLLGHVLNKQRIYLYVHFDEPLQIVLCNPTKQLASEVMGTVFKEPVKVIVVSIIAGFLDFSVFQLLVNILSPDIFEVDFLFEGFVVVDDDAFQFAQGSPLAVDPLSLVVGIGKVCAVVFSFLGLHMGNSIRMLFQNRFLFHFFYFGQRGVEVDFTCINEILQEISLIQSQCF